MPCEVLVSTENKIKRCVGCYWNKDLHHNSFRKGEKTEDSFDLKSKFKFMSFFRAFDQL